MKYVFLSVGLLMALAACGDASQKAERVANDLKANVYATKERVQKWAETPPEKPKKRSVPPSYCYQAYQDILCYRQPMPGWEGRLVGFQGTGVLPPNPATTQPLPKRMASTSMSPADRALAAQPLSVGEVPQPKADTVASDDPAALAADPIHESLPDPTTAQQL